MNKGSSEKGIRSYSVKTLVLLIISVQILFFSAFSLSAQSSGALNSMVTRVLIDSLSNQLVKYYVFKEAALRMSAQLKKRYEEGHYNRVEDPNELAALITSDINEVHKDEHFHVEYNPQLANEVSGNIDDVPKMVAQKLEQEKSKNYGFKKVEILPGNIGYLEISSFSRVNNYSKAVADAALKFLSGSRAIIIDLRYGKGGSPDMVNYIASHFFRSKTHIADIYVRSENNVFSYWTSPDSSYAALNKIPLFILTSYRTFSAAEGLAYSLQSLKRALVVGEVSRGGAHTVTYKPLSNGFVCDIPFGRLIDPVTKRNWEGKGVEPDIKSEADKALEVAEYKIFGTAMAAAKDSIALNNLLWQLKILKSINHPFDADTLTLKSFVGDFGSTSLSYEKGALYLQKPGTARISLLPINRTQFRPLGNDSYTIEITGDTPKNLSLIIYYEDGRIEKAVRRNN